MIVTVFLIVLIASLLLGNLLLSLMKPKKGNPNNAAAHTGQYAKSNPVLCQSINHSEENLSVRIDRLEKMLLKVNGSDFLGKKLEGTIVGKKLRDFTAFKTNTNVELAALKEDLANVKKHAGVTEIKKPGEDFEISDEKLHTLVFRGNTGKA